MRQVQAISSAAAQFRANVELQAQSYGAQIQAQASEAVHQARAQATEAAHQAQTQPQTSVSGPGHSPGGLEREQKALQEEAKKAAT